MFVLATLALLQTQSRRHRDRLINPSNWVVGISRLDTEWPLAGHPGAVFSGCGPDKLGRSWWK